MEAISADHLVYPSEKGLESMRMGGVIAVLLPGTVFMLDLKDRPPAGRFRELGIPIALASDMNPGTCVIESMQVIAGLACLLLKMSPAEVLVASTINAAYALDRGDSIGSIEAGKQADILLFDVPNYKYLVYYFTTSHLTHVMKKGELLFSRDG
jgi:imidazolonepropionase